MINVIYQVGGSLPPQAISYIPRHADEELYQSLKSGQFCYVLNARQMGKSSLCVRVMQRLQQESITCAAVDITLIGTQQINPQQWYGSLSRTLLASFQMEDRLNLRAWWQERQELSPVQCFSEFVEHVLLVEIQQPIVIFIDEIDSMLQVDFKDDFFALIRAFYNRRVDRPIYNRLTFALIGVATPADLIGNKIERTPAKTPFNIGKPIELQGLQLSNTRPLAEGLAAKSFNKEELLKAILGWTGGQPFLTQKLCKLLVDEESVIPDGKEVEWIDNLVKVRIIDNWEANDSPEHLQTIRNGRI
jgi:hypothetical protein